MELHYLWKALMLLHIYNVEEIRSRVFEVRAKMVLDLMTHGFHRLIEDVGDEWYASRTTCTGFCTRLDLPDRFAIFFLEKCGDGTL
jgi:hypothetical protein